MNYRVFDPQLAVDEAYGRIPTPPEFLDDLHGWRAGLLRALDRCEEEQFTAANDDDRRGRVHRMRVKLQRRLSDVNRLIEEAAASSDRALVEWLIDEYLLDDQDELLRDVPPELAERLADVLAALASRTETA